MSLRLNHVVLSLFLPKNQKSEWILTRAVTETKIAGMEVEDEFAAATMEVAVAAMWIQNFR